MKALVITGSRADRNGLEVVHQALLKAGHQSAMPSHFAFGCCESDPGDYDVDVAILGGDRSEILCAALTMSRARIPIAHIAGGDITEGSADDRYRDAITALSCVHFPTNDAAYKRLLGDHMTKAGDGVYMTGSPAIDRIKQTPVLSAYEIIHETGIDVDKTTVLVCVHPNTVGDNRFTDYEAVRGALKELRFQVIWLGANADGGGEIINKCARLWCEVERWRFIENVSPQLYYSLMTHCDVMVGNSSAMLYEAPSFGLPCVLVGDRQRGRIIPSNVVCVKAEANDVEVGIKSELTAARIQTVNPYGDGNSAPRIVKALEDNAWRWSSKASKMSHVKQNA